MGLYYPINLFITPILLKVPKLRHSPYHRFIAGGGFVAAVCQLPYRTTSPTRRGLMETTECAAILFFESIRDLAVLDRLTVAVPYNHETASE